MITIADFINNSKLTRQNLVIGYNAEGDALINVKLKFNDFVFNQIIIAKDYITNDKLPKTYQIKESIFIKHFNK